MPDTPRLALLVSIVLSAVVVGACSRQTTLPKEMSGSYEHEQSSLLALVTGPEALTVTEAGMAVTGSAMQNLEVSLKLDPAGSPKGQLGAAGAGDLFSRVKCATPVSCTFSTKGGCEGTVDKQGDALLIIATERCGAWSGRWVPAAKKTAPMFP